jgi:hypothetical protein
MMSNQAVILELGLALKHPRAERRACVRYQSNNDAVSRPINEGRGISWGATVQTISTTGIGLHLCFPFRPDALVVIELQGSKGPRTLAAKVVHVSDQHLGSWVVGCAFLQPITEDELDDVL